MPEKLHDYPMLIIIKQVAKVLLMNEFEMLVWGCIMDKIGWGGLVTESESNQTDIQMSIESTDSNNEKCIELYLLTIGFIIKEYVCGVESITIPKIKEYILQKDPTFGGMYDKLKLKIKEALLMTTFTNLNDKFVENIKVYIYIYYYYICIIGNNGWREFTKGLQLHGGRDHRDISSV